MKCFYFSNPDRKSDNRSRKSIWTPSWSGGSNPEGRRSGSSDITSQTISTISDVSGDSPGSNILQCSSQRPANDLRVFSYAELRASTRNFSRMLMIGEGGFGCVYKGWVRSVDDHHSKIEVAVKQLNRKGLQGHKEWVTEVHFLGLVKHLNLVKLVGYCAEDDERGIQRLLVYEFMPNKSLEDHLFSRVLPVLPWNLRLQIALGAARGLAYLHEEMDFQIIFRDLKTSNILLDEDFNPKLSDFGLARQGPTPGISHVSTAVVGTVGYAAPEYIQTGHLTTKSDVWSFGVVLYELLTGRRSMDRNLPKNEQKLLEWVKPYISDGKRFHLIMDPRLEGQYSLKSAQKVACVAHSCLVKHARSRPKMSEVVDLLKRIIETSDAGTSQAFHTCPDVETSTEILTQPVKPAVNSKRRMLLLRDIVIFRSREKDRPAWRAWSPKMPRTL